MRYKPPLRVLTASFAGLTLMLGKRIVGQRFWLYLIEKASASTGAFSFSGSGYVTGANPFSRNPKNADTLPPMPQSVNSDVISAGRRSSERPQVLLKNDAIPDRGKV
ncbi:hypothetical protein [Candidatus Burkholderia verschuerenii]|uniref:hypothetical protein n=1 Tax=Candidatus Burkholderia verschuerenii TaxID=242163 RepID=UPI000A4F875D|nr:hypothetical protein [Candidatus Burkholderia verschuerenii]